MWAVEAVDDRDYYVTERRILCVCDTRAVAEEVCGLLMAELMREERLHDDWVDARSAHRRKFVPPDLAVPSNFVALNSAESWKAGRMRQALAAHMELFTVPRPGRGISRDWLEFVAVEIPDPLSAAHEAYAVALSAARRGR